MLPSQTTRLAGTTPTSMVRMTRDKPRNYRPFVIGGGALFVLVLCIWGLSKIGGGKTETPLGPKSAAATPPSRPMSTLQQPNPAAAQAPQPVVPAAPPPFELHQGRPRASAPNTPVINASAP